MRYIKIRPEYLVSEASFNFDIFVEVRGRIVLYRSKDYPITKRQIEEILAKERRGLYIGGDQEKNLHEHMERNLTKILKNEKIPEKERAKVLYDCSSSVIKDVLDDPRSGENIGRVKSVATNTVDFLIKSGTAFRHLTKITSYDYYTYTHSLNVCTFSLGIAHVGLRQRNRSFLSELAFGAMLHDIGKSEIQKEILNKKGPLDSAEWDLMRRHPELGVEIASEIGGVAGTSLCAIAEHHEKVDGSGYPKGLTGDEIHLFGRITSIADVFDALTTTRSYKDRLNPFPALQIMIEEKEKFDTDILKTFIELLSH